MRVLLVSHSDGSLMAEELRNETQVETWARFLRDCDPYRNLSYCWRVVVAESVRDAA